DVLAKVTKKNNDLSTTVEEKTAELYNSEGQRLAQNGKHFTEVGKKQQNRQLTEIRRKAKHALWFGETYGLMPESLRLRDKTGQSHDINLREIP
ncbi:unnamed protein product, partial [Pocillopora meandrina]